MTLFLNSTKFFYQKPKVFFSSHNLNFWESIFEDDGPEFDPNQSQTSLLCHDFYHYKRNGYRFTVNNSNVDFNPVQLGLFKHLLIKGHFGISFKTFEVSRPTKLRPLTPDWCHLKLVLI